jgi:hypothetical protein
MTMDGEDVAKKILMDWYEARDLLIGDNGLEQDIERALLLASSCEYEEARWLTALFDGRRVRDKDEARDVFLEAPDDARAIFFAEAVLEEEEQSQGEILRSALMGYTLALAWVTRRFKEDEEDEQDEEDEEEENEEVEESEEETEWAEKPASQGERNGLFAMRRSGEAAKLGHVKGMQKQGRLSKWDPQYYVHLGNAAIERGTLWTDFASMVQPELKRFFESHSRLTRSCVFVIGRLFVKNSAPRKPSMLADMRTADVRLAMSFYEIQCGGARNAVNAWTLVGIRLRVVKDIRIMIGMLIWSAREEAKY